MGVISPVMIDGKAHYVMRVSQSALIDIAHVLDRYRIIEQRRALARLGFDIKVERGREWWM